MFFITKFGLNAQSLKYVVLLKEEGFTDKENFLELNGALISKESLTSQKKGL